MSNHPSRRDLVRYASLAAGAGLAAGPAAVADAPPTKEAFRFSFNTSTIMGQKLPLPEEVDIAGKAGYQAFEPWIRELDEYVKSGGSLKDLGKRIRDRGMTVESSIGFIEWLVDDEARRKKALEEARRVMDMVQQLGGKRLAAPPVGATDRSDIPLLAAAERYRALLDIGDRIGVIPQVEVWGFSKSLSRLGETAYVAIESEHPKACILADVYHLHKGGSGFTGLSVLGRASMHVFHLNDYPATPPRKDITDAHRVYPGDGVAPLVQMLRDLRALGFHGHLSLELFNRDYWKQDPQLVATTGLEKMKAVVKASLEEPK
jgi:sugar phosphate isomerase/epimerase